ncbi:polysaccharide biosynthesis/export family protein [uncultured Erythrobacter sp.]|uniref:polysaccharide biosynthesis/export family protein n=1 Tax=uncultured Erythrobacter sp. TaxID=263913 RepID=UPI002602A17F|nr:polysaccharide biosynthesis/export family protein [uncultured Erythrobacter sp.]
MRDAPRFERAFRLAAMGLGALALGACSSFGGTGPSTGRILDASDQSYADTGIQVIELGPGVASQLNAHSASTSFAEVFGESATSATVVGPGDVLDIAIWEAPPAVLFGTGAPDASLDVASTAEIPQQQVGEDGRVTVPFVGRIDVAGLRPEQIEAIIASRLNGRANNPQALVRLVQNESRTVTVLGNVATSGRVVLSARGERLLDALASAGGTREPIGQSTIQLARGSTLTAMPLEQVIADPRQNIGLRAGDVITLQHQPFSFVALGAVARSAEVPFEGAGISLAEALGRVGGLNDRRADVKGVFVFRMEPRGAVDPLLEAGAQTTADGRVPVVYSLRMTDAQSLFAMQDFRMQDGDVLYISTAPGVELERFLTLLSSTAFSIVATANAVDSGNQ